MAEIHVERKRGVGAWVWVLLLALLLVAAAVYLWQTGYINLSANIMDNTPLLSATLDIASANAGGINGA